MKMERRRTIYVTLAMLFAAYATGCGFVIPKDVDGNRPVDVARRFVESVRKGDIEGAASCWREGDTRNIEGNRRESFAQFCEYFRSESYVLEFEGSDKGVYWVRFLGTDSGKTRAQVLYLDPPSKSQDGRWKLREDDLRESHNPAKSQ
jgi:hypothetical protein